MNEIEVANYIKKRILQKKYRDYIEGNTLTDTIWYRGYNQGLESAGEMIDIILDDHELNEVVTTKFNVCQNHVPCPFCNKDDIMVMLEGHPFKLHETDSDPEPDYIIIQCRNCGHQVKLKRFELESIDKLTIRAFNRWNELDKIHEQSKEPIMNSKTDKMNELKSEMMKRATDAKNTIGFIPCDESFGVKDCTDCIYHSDTFDDFGSHCKPIQVKNLLREIIKLSEITPPQYVIVSKSERVFGPASKEACESMAKNLENVEVKKCD